MRTRVKICGITNLADAKTVVEAGADALGFIFVPETPRYIEPTDAAAIISALPPFITTVGVFRNAQHKVIREIAAQCSITSAQLHGTESPEYCAQISLPVIKVFELQKESDLKTLDTTTLVLVLWINLNLFRQELSIGNWHLRHDFGLKS